MGHINAIKAELLWGDQVVSSSVAALLDGPGRGACSETAVTVSSSLAWTEQSSKASSALTSQSSRFTTSKIVVIRCPAVVIIWLSPICSTTAAACQSIHEYIHYLYRMLFPGGRPTSLAFPPLVGKNWWIHPGLFQQTREEPDPGWIRERLQSKVTEDRWRILDCLDVFVGQRIWNHNIEKRCTRSWDAAWQTWYDLKIFSSITLVLFWCALIKPSEDSFSEQVLKNMNWSWTWCSCLHLYAQGRPEKQKDY